MSFFQAVFLAIVQGLTEFLPVSSSGHLVLFQEIFGLTEPPVFFDVLLHTGTLLAVVIFLRKEITGLFKNWQDKQRVWLSLLIGSLPVGILGFILNPITRKIFGSLRVVGLMWLIFGAFLLWSKKIGSKKGELKKELGQISRMDAFLIGLFQAAALFPGISRAGSTIIGGLFRRLSPQNAFVFSFLLSLPAIIGANLLKLGEGQDSTPNFFVSLLAVVVAGLTGFLALKLLRRVILSEKWHFFGFYCLFLGILVLILA